MTPYFARTFSLLLFWRFCCTAFAVNEPLVCLSFNLRMRPSSDGRLENYNSKLSLSCPNNCTDGWTWAEGICLLADMSRRVSWNEGRKFCKEKHENAHLVTVRDANEFAEVLRYVRNTNAADQFVNFWIGGSDLDQNNEWHWVTGESMLMESPFWGSWGGVKQPDTTNDEHCAFLFQPDRYYIHDAGCREIAIPLCQYRPLCC